MLGENPEDWRNARDILPVAQGSSTLPIAFQTAICYSTNAVAGAVRAAVEGWETLKKLTRTAQLFHPPIPTTTCASLALVPMSCELEGLSDSTAIADCLQRSTEFLLFRLITFTSET